MLCTIISLMLTMTPCKLASKPSSFVSFASLEFLLVVGSRHNPNKYWMSSGTRQKLTSQIDFLIIKMFN